MTKSLIDILTIQVRYLRDRFAIQNFTNVINMTSGDSTEFDANLSATTGRGRYARISRETKERLVEAWENGRDYLEVARILNVNTSTARSIILQYQRGESLDDKRGGSRPQVLKLTPAVIQNIVQLVERHPDFTLVQIQKFCETPLSITSISRALDGQLISVKKLEDCPMRRNAQDVKEARSGYAEWYLNGGLSKTIIYVDETCFNIFTKRTRGRSRIGTTAVRQIGGQRGPNLSLIMAVASGVGIVYFELLRGTVNKERFQHYLDNLGTILQEMDVNDPTVVMDNAPIHGSASCCEFPIQKLPAYSPFLNPIENAFSVFKLKLRAELREDSNINLLSSVPTGMSLAEHRMRVLHDLAKTTLEDQETVSGSKVENMCQHVMRYMHRCLALADIIV